MKFKAIVSGCALQPAKAPQQMQSIIRSLNESTVAQLSSAIDLNLLRPGWKIVGGWKNWLHTIIKNFVQFLGKFFEVPSLASFGAHDPQSFEERLVVYFQSQDYCIGQAREMANIISRM